MEKLLILAAILAGIIIFPNLNFSPKVVKADEVTPKETLSALQPIHTTSRFETKLITTTEDVPKQTITKDNPNKELDDDTVLDEGKDGTKTTITKVYYYEGQIFSQDIVSVTTVPPENEIVDHGTKIVWRTIDTPDGPITYWRKLTVWATQYDSHCPGCDNTTATGLPQGKGVIAVDPSVIKLGSKLYVTGYGEAIAGDTGGAVKGNMIDVGFPDAHTSGWTSHSVDIYLQ